MSFYYVFDHTKADDLDTAFSDVEGQGRYDFVAHQKLVRPSKLRRSNLDATPPNWTRCVMSLEVDTWAPEDAALKAAAEAAAEFWSEDNLAFLEYLNTPDALPNV